MDSLKLDDALNFRAMYRNIDPILHEQAQAFLCGILLHCCCCLCLARVPPVAQAQPSKPTATQTTLLPRFPATELYEFY